MGRKSTQDRVDLISEEEQMDGTDGNNLQPSAQNSHTNASAKNEPPVTETPPGVGGENDLHFKLKRKSMYPLHHVY